MRGACIADGTGRVGAVLTARARPGEPPAAYARARDRRNQGTSEHVVLARARSCCCVSVDTRTRTYLKLPNAHSQTREPKMRRNTRGRRRDALIIARVTRMGTPSCIWARTSIRRQNSNIAYVWRTRLSPIALSSAGAQMQSTESSLARSAQSADRQPMTSPCEGGRKRERRRFAFA